MKNFPKKNRILKSSEYKATLAQGEKAICRNLVCWATPNLQGRSRMGLIVSKKVGNAVKRNRIKRKLKGVVQKMLRVNNSINLNYTYVIFGKEKIYSEHSNSLFKNMEKSFNKINKE